MRSLSSVGLGLTLVFGCLLLALIAELYYLLWWKKRFTSRIGRSNATDIEVTQNVYMFCWKTPKSSTGLNPQQARNRDTLFENHGQDVTSSPAAQRVLHGHHRVHNNNNGHNKDLLLKPFGEDGVESEFMRLYDLSSSGPQRLLFTIKEETREDLDESLSLGSGLSDHIILTIQTEAEVKAETDTPYLTPLSSPPFFTPPLTPIKYHHRNGFSFNPLYDYSTSDAHFNKMASSPPPKFKFLQDAEEKHYRRKLMEEDEDDKRVDQEICFKAHLNSTFMEPIQASLAEECLKEFIVSEHEAITESSYSVSGITSSSVLDDEFTWKEFKYKVIESRSNIYDTMLDDEFTGKEFRVMLKEEARDIEAFCCQLVKMEEDAVEN